MDFVINNFVIIKNKSYYYSKFTPKKQSFMRVRSFAINGFRNLGKLSLDLKEGFPVTAFVGANGHGKTNLLEALFLLAISKSFRTNENEDLIGFEEDFCSLKATVQQGDEETELEIIVTRQPPKKTLKVNGVIQKAADYIGHLNAVFFSPDDIGMIHLSPSVRRRYLDMLLSQLDRDYLDASLKYQLVVRQRNALLKQIADETAEAGELEIWDQQLTGSGLKIMEKRQGIIGKLNAEAARYYGKLTDAPDELKITYRPSLEKVKTEEEYLYALQKSRKRDILNGSTKLGPHRDDLMFLCNGHNMASFASRGEWRSLVLTLKFAEIDLLKEKNGFYPILLLDDVFSELDKQRQKYLFNIIKNTQTFITTTHKEFLEVIDGDKQLFEVREGKVHF